jgi:hypothetical protein
VIHSNPAPETATAAWLRTSDETANPLAAYILALEQLEQAQTSGTWVKIAVEVGPGAQAVLIL